MKKINKVITLLFLILLIGCNNTNNIHSKKDNIKNLNLPLDYKILNYKKKDNSGYFIYDDSFKKNINIYGISRILGNILLNDSLNLVFVEKKPDGDEHIEPIGILYIFKDKIKLDSLIVYENVQWEGSYNKKFKITSDLSIYLYENSKYYELEDITDKEKIMNIKDSSIYKITKQGKFKKVD